MLDTFPTEEEAWKYIEPCDLWIMDKLILARTMGYMAGPVGTAVPYPGEYIVRPCVNALGLGLGAQKLYLTPEQGTDHLPVGHFWCEWFEGDHYSIDYLFGEQILAVKGIKQDDTFTQWDAWIRDDSKRLPLPAELGETPFKYPWVNIEYIGGHIIEVHFRGNQDFTLIDDQQEFIPVWLGQDTIAPEGYQYFDYPDVHGRIGAFVK